MFLGLHLHTPLTWSPTRDQAPPPEHVTCPSWAGSSFQDPRPFVAPSKVELEPFVFSASGGCCHSCHRQASRTGLGQRAALQAGLVHWFSHTWKFFLAGFFFRLGEGPRVSPAFQVPGERGLCSPATFPSSAMGSSHPWAEVVNTHCLLLESDFEPYSLRGFRATACQSVPRILRSLFLYGKRKWCRWHLGQSCFYAETAASPPPQMLFLHSCGCRLEGSSTCLFF